MIVYGMGWDNNVEISRRQVKIWPQITQILGDNTSHTIKNENWEAIRP